MHPVKLSKMNIQDTMREILRAESEAILNIPVTDAYTRAVELIVDLSLIHISEPTRRSV